MEPYTQICFVVRDFEKGIAQWTALGAGPFYAVDMSLLPPDRTYRGEIATDTFLVSRGFLGTTQIEITTPTNSAPSIYQEVLKDRGEGLHHVQPCIKPTTPEQFDTKCAEYEAMGFEQASAMVVPGIGRVVFYDSYKKLGYFIELTERTEEMHAASVAAYNAHLTWDGADPIR